MNAIARRNPAIHSAINPAINPVILVHGHWDTSRVFRKLSVFLRSRGHKVFAPDLLPSGGELSIAEMSQLLAVYIDQHLPPGAPFDLIGFSMGGIIARHYVQRRDGLRRVERLITLSSPHNGTLTAYLLPYQGIKDMRPRSHFLLDLNRDASALDRINFTSLWTPFDLMIVPARSSSLPAIREIKVDVILHRWIPVDATVFAAIATELDRPFNPPSPLLPALAPK